VEMHKLRIPLLSTFFLVENEKDRYDATSAMLIMVQMLRESHRVNW
jgi:hypothetical protein